MKQGIVDIGNTGTKFAIFTASNMLESGVASSLAELTSKLNALCSHIFIGNTSHQEKKALLLENLEPDKVFELNDYKKLPVDLGKYTPKSLGLDRLANAFQAIKTNKNAATLVVDCGTCITYDAVFEEKFFGFGISPGLKTRLESMHFATAALPKLNFTKEFFLKSTFFNPDSSNQMLDSVMLGTIAEIENRIDYCRKQFNACNVVLTGGDAESLKKHIKISTFADPYWTLKGYNEILLNII